MAGMRQQAFQKLLDCRHWLRRAGMDAIAQRHSRLGSAFRTVYHPVYRLLQPGGMMTAEFGGIRISADTNQRDLALLLRGEADWEWRQTRLIGSMLGEGMVFVDVGAHIGLYTLLAASRVGPRGRVFAFEPAPDNFRVLQYNIAQNGFTNVSAEPVAVSRGRGRAVFTLSENDSASHTLAPALHKGRTIEAETISLDEYFSERKDRIDLVKLDAEGAELSILEGMERILARHPKLILFTEIYPRAMEAFGSSPEEFLRRLSDLGFSLVPFEETRPGEARLESQSFSRFLNELRAHGVGTNLLCQPARARNQSKSFTRPAPNASGQGAPGKPRRPLISVAIPTYNRGRLLEETLASILPQTDESVEVVVYDTGSADDTSERVEKLAQDSPALRFFSVAERHSLDETLLRLLDVCRGEYVWFFSSDDQMNPGAIEAVRKRILGTRERPALVYINQEIVDETGKTLVVSQVGNEGSRDFRDGRKILPWLGLNLGFISASVFRRESALHAATSSAHEFVGTRSLNLHLYLRCLLEGGAALYVGEPLIRARRAPGAPPYEYADVFVRDIVRILDDAGQRGFGRLAIYRAMHRIVAGQYLRLVFSWRAEDPVELARTFPVMAKACWKYPAFWLLLIPVRFAPSALLWAVRNHLRDWRDARNERRQTLASAPAVESRSIRASGALRTPFHALLVARRLIASLGGERIFKAIPYLIPAYRKAYAYLRPNEIVRTECRGHEMYLDPADVEVARSLISLGSWEEHETRIFSAAVKEGMVVVDIGANIGHYTLEAARRVGETGRVFAFEPEPHNFGLLCRNVEANRYRNVVSVRKALSNRTGVGRLTLSAGNLGGHHLKNSGEQGEDVAVSMITLDEFLLDEPRPIDVIKMDAEGAEMGILEGMKGVLEANPDLILFTEFSPRAIRAAGNEPEKFLEALAEASFHLGILDQSSSRIEELPEVPLSEFSDSLLRADCGRFYVDLLCLRGKALQEQFGPRSWQRDSVFAKAGNSR